MSYFDISVVSRPCGRALLLLVLAVSSLSSADRSFPLQTRRLVLLPRRPSGLLSLRGGRGLLACFGATEEENIAPLTVEVADAPAKEGEGKPRRNARFPELIHLPMEGNPEIDTPYAAFNYSAVRFPERKCLGHRELLPDGKRGGYMWQMYGEVSQQVKALGEGLVRVCGLARGSRCGIYATNRPEWTESMLGMWSQGLVCVPLYDSVGSDAVRYIINHAALPVVFCERSKLATLLEAAKDSRTLRHIVLFEPLQDDDVDGLHKAGSRRDLKLHSWTEVKAASRESSGSSGAAQRPGELAMVLYTSGTTGDPKGVMLTAGNMLASAAGCLLMDATYDGQDTQSSLRFDGATYMSYLPLAHSFELNMQILMLTAGASIGFYQGDVRRLVTDDLPALRPSILPGVPRVYSRIYDKVVGTMEAKGPVLRALFRWGLRANERAMARGSRSWLWDSLIFKKLQAVLGGNVAMLLSGAAPLSSELHSFLKVAFNAPVIQGYGMTENAGAAVVMPPTLSTVGTVGVPLPCTEVKLVDVPEMEYSTEDRYPSTREEFEQQVTFKGSFDPAMAGKQLPRGEICMRGRNIMQGYYKLEGETAGVLDAEGWLHTGDVGQWNLDGSLSIIDRKKNIFKLSQGEYIAVESIEAVVSSSRFVLQSWVYGNSLEPALVAVVVPDKEAVLSWCKKHGISGSLQQVCRDSRVQKMILSDIRECCVSASLRGYEQPKAIHLEVNNLNELGQGFTVQNDCLTPSFKLRRPQLLRRYSQQVDVMYQQIRESLQLT